MARRKGGPLIYNSFLKIANGLPSNIAASIGRIVIRYSYCEWVQARTIDALLGISIKQGRVAVRVPQSRAFANTVRDLLKFHRLGLEDYSFRQFGLKLEKAEAARNILAHSIYARDPDTKEIHIQIVRGSWELGKEAEAISKAITPETRIVDAAFLKEKRADVEAAIAATTDVHGRVLYGLAALNETRRTQREKDRRSQSRSPAKPHTQPQSSRA